jgi:hypothetical protein
VTVLRCGRSHEPGGDHRKRALIPVSKSGDMSKVRVKIRTHLSANKKGPFARFPRTNFLIASTVRQVGAEFACPSDVNI